MNPKAIRRAERVYCFLLKLYPEQHRKIHGEALLGCFLDLYRHTARRTIRPLFWARTLADIIWNAILLRLDGPRPSAHPKKGEGLMSTWGQDFAYAWRKLRRNPAWTALAVSTLALGIGANTAIFSALEMVFLRPLPYRQAEQLVIVWPESWFSKGEFDYYEQGFESLQELSAVQPQSVTLTGMDEPERLDGVQVSARLFALLGVEPAWGRPFWQAEDRPGGGRVAVISYGLWQRRFAGSAAALDRPVTLNGQPHRIVGVLPAGFFLPLEAAVWLPLQSDPAQRDYEGTYQLKIVARLGEGASAQQAEEELQRLARLRREQRPDLHSEEYGKGAQVLPLRSALLSDFQDPLIFLQAAVALVLLMACANIANLLLASGAARQRELAVRAALGAKRGRLLRQLLSESLLLSGLGGLLAIAVAYWGIAALTLPQDVPSWVRLDLNGTVLAGTAAICLLSGLAFGTLPALRFSRPELRQSLQQGGRAGDSSGGNLRRLLVGCEVALAVILTSAAALMLQSFWKHSTVDPGFDPRGVLTLRLHPSSEVFETDNQRRAFYRQVVEQTSALPSVRSSALAQHVSLSGLYWLTTVDIEGQPSPGDRGFAVGRMVVGDGYFRTMGIGLEQGRTFGSQDDADSQPAAVINQALQRRFWPGQDALGKRLRMHGARDDRWMTVVGVVADERFERLDAPVRPRFYQLHEQYPMRTMSLLVRADQGTDPRSLAPSVRQAVWGIDRKVPVSRVRALQDVIADSLAVPRLLAQLLAIFGVLALLLGAGGIYGVLAHSVTRQRHEIGVRMALGARRGQVRRLIMQQGMLPVLIGLAVGWLGALAIGGWIEGLLFGITAHDPATLTLVPALLLSVAAAACFLPARQATRADPLIALRSD